jgi:hypothetical protein
LDSSVTLLKQNGNEKDRETYQAYLTATEWNFNYVPTDRTLSQFRSYGHRLIRNSVVADLLSQLEILYKIYSGINDHVRDMQNDIDGYSYIFADKAIADGLFISEYPFPEDVSIKLDDIPVSARINKADPEFQNFISRLKKYNYYVATSLKGEYLRILKFQYSSINILKKEYHLK